MNEPLRLHYDCFCDRFRTGKFVSFSGLLRRQLVMNTLKRKIFRKLMTRVRRERRRRNARRMMLWKKAWRELRRQQEMNMRRKIPLRPQRPQRPHQHQVQPEERPAAAILSPAEQHERIRPSPTAASSGSESKRNALREKLLAIKALQDELGLWCYALTSALGFCFHNRKLYENIRFPTIIAVRIPP